MIKYCVRFGNYVAIIEANSISEAEDISQVEFGRKNGPYYISEATEFDLVNHTVGNQQIFKREKNFRINLDV